jgi:hypothetical protein
MSEPADPINVSMTVADQTRPPATLPQRPLRRLWVCLALVFTALCVIQGGHQLWQSAGLPSGMGSLGLRSDQGCIGAELCRVETVSPGGPADAAGIRVGDRLRREGVNVVFTGVRIGETVAFLRQEPAGARRILVVADPAPSTVVPEYIVAGIIFMLAGALGGLVIARSGGRRSVILIGLAYASYAITGQWPRLWQSVPELYPYFYVPLSVIYYGSPLLFLAGARALRREVSGRDTFGLRLAFWGLVAIQGGILAYQLNAELSGRRGLFGDDAFLAYAIPVLIGYTLAASVLAMTWRESPPEARSRYGIMLIAIGATFLSGLFDMGILLTGNDYTTLSPLLLSWYVAFTAGVCLFTYAILRHRVIDLGFAVNRTLVFGVLSTTLLFAFFLLEWGAEQIIPVETREANMLISAGIAFAIFLTFHHVRDWVEKAIERLFFRIWREKEAALRRFVKQSAFVTRPEALKASSVAAFGRYADEAEVALYVAQPDGYRLDAGQVAGIAPLIDPDAPEMIRLRAEREAFDDGLPPGAALILPMLHRNEITGFFLFGPKGSAETYRPDERSNLSEAAVKIGLDLHALRVEALETESREQRRRADLLERQLEHRLTVGAA